MHYCDYKERSLRPQAVRMNSPNIVLLAINLLIPRDASLCKATIATSAATDHPTRSVTPSGQEPQIMALFGSLPLKGAKAFSFFLFPSTSAT